MSALYKAGFLGVVGLPNAGKSTLVNAMVGEKVSIVTNKPQTTRQRIEGILTLEDMQIVFVDAPGLVKGTKGINAFLEQEAREVISESDALFFTIAAGETPQPLHDELLKLLKDSHKPWRLLVTQSEFTPNQELKNWLSEREAEGIQFIRISFHDQPGPSRETLITEARKILPESPAPLFDPELFTTQNMREIAAETIREKCFEFLHQEIPYGLGVRIVKFDETGESISRIFADLVISKENHKAMVIGEGGQMIKKIGSAARLSLEEQWQTKIYLELHVAVKKEWTQADHFLKDLGYQVEKKK